MPQINQLSYLFSSQLFWLIVVFGIIYFVIAGTMLPKVRSVVDGRSERIAEEIERAEAARTCRCGGSAGNLGAASSKQRGRRPRSCQEAKQAADQRNEALLNAAVASIDLKVGAALQGIRSAVAASRVEMDRRLPQPCGTWSSA